MDVLKMINNLKKNLWEKYGDVLASKRSQEEIHMTYYVSDLLKRHGYKHSVFSGTTYYTEAALLDAFTAGTRINKIDEYEVYLKAKEEILEELHCKLREL